MPCQPEDVWCMMASPKQELGQSAFWKCVVRPCYTPAALSASWWSHACLSVASTASAPGPNLELPDGFQSDLGHLFGSKSVCQRWGLAPGRQQQHWDRWPETP
eukprot:1161952-Pelagomonas_calceolata.AAC.3